MKKPKQLKYNTKDIATIYDDQALDYAGFAKGDFSWDYIEKPLLDRVFSLPYAPHNPSVLDAGCGVGRTLKYLVNRGIPRTKITGLDISQKMLSLAKKEVPGIKTVQANVVDFETKDKFDFIICIHVLHYLNNKDYKHALRNFYKLLNPRGLLFIMSTHPMRTVRHDLAEYFKRSWIEDRTPWGATNPLYLRPVCDFVNETIRAGLTLKSLEEPSIPVSAKKIDPVKYLKYTCCPSRIGVVAQR